MIMKLKDCEICRGDLVFDDGEWRCLQCGRCYYPKPQLLAQRTAFSAWKRGNRGGLTDRDINSLVQSRTGSDERWFSRNHQVIDYLKEGRSLKEIASLTGSTARSVREVRQRWREPVLA